jgi:hypothetical protein
MAKGTAPIKERAEAAAEQQRRFQEQNDNLAPMLYGKEIRRGGPDGGPLIVRFLEQGEDVNSFERHPITRPGQQYPDWHTCLSEINMDCSACRAGLKSSRKGAYNLIVRNRAVLRKGADGKAIRNPDKSFIIDGYADQVVVWECSTTTANYLVRADNDFRGLMSQDFQLRYTGNDKNPYDIFPADIQVGAQPMSDDDLGLAAKKYDLDKVFAPPTQAEMQELVRKYGANSGASGPVASQMPTSVPQVAAANPYAAGAQLPPTAFPPQQPAQAPAAPQPVPAAPTPGQ